jgi:hypothetical protein
VLQTNLKIVLPGEPNPDALKTKKSELRLYCDLLMQQVHVIKNAASGEKGPEVEVSDLSVP